MHKRTWFSSTEYVVYKSSHKTKTYLYIYFSSAYFLNQRWSFKRITDFLELRLWDYASPVLTQSTKSFHQRLHLQTINKLWVCRLQTETSRQNDSFCPRAAKLLWPLHCLKLFCWSSRYIIDIFFIVHVVWLIHM